MRTQYCRHHIDRVAEECGLHPDTVREVKDAADFCDNHPEFSKCSTRALRDIIRIKNPEEKVRAIEAAKARLNIKMPNGGTRDSVLKTKDIENIIKKVRQEMGAPEETGGACEICGKKFTKRERPHEDHCHRSGMMRGKLCMNCNTGIGQFHDDTELLLKAIQYIRKYELLIAQAENETRDLELRWRKNGV